ncbi:hypothetical protein G7Y89_g2199 [Cudoniella acicularis]|uniref:Aminoglycoside phosphotransferase domain-containing protein n=1 Tax=Cudoniella acicularis TaxID=354080 RepID=A0A8H4W6Q4_9HELO|nr:hypothetical protein G7Y89_g2199 [Cudoniella acicularis]
MPFIDITLGNWESLDDVPGSNGGVIRLMGLDFVSHMSHYLIMMAYSESITRFELPETSPATLLKHLKNSTNPSAQYDYDYYQTSEMFTHDDTEKSQGQETLEAKSPAIRPTETKLIKSTRFRRFLVLAAIKLLKRIRPHHGTVIFVSDKLCIKYGPLRHLPEASTMQFIAQHTSIPVPKVHCTFTRKGWTYIAMERINGEMMGQGWVNRSDESKAKLLAQLKGLIEEMRKIQPPEGQGVSNVDGGQLWDCRIPGKTLCHGPFESIDDFHRYLRGGFDAHPDHYPEVSRLIELQDRPWPGPVFTHGDLSSLNILIRGDEVVGIIDWETAGWYPSYWEYTSASQVNPRNYFWREEIPKFLEPIPEALEMETIRQKYFGDT